MQRHGEAYGHFQAREEKSAAGGRAGKGERSAPSGNGPGVVRPRRCASPRVEVAKRGGFHGAEAATRSLLETQAALSEAAAGWAALRVRRGRGALRAVPRVQWHRPSCRPAPERCGSRLGASCNFSRLVLARRFDPAVTPPCSRQNIFGGRRRCGCIPEPVEEACTFVSERDVLPQRRRISPEARGHHPCAVRSLLSTSGSDREVARWTNSWTEWLPPLESTVRAACLTFSRSSSMTETPRGWRLNPETWL